MGEASCSDIGDDEQDDEEDARHLHALLDDLRNANPFEYSQIHRRNGERKPIKAAPAIARNGPAEYVGLRT